MKKAFIFVVGLLLVSFLRLAFAEEFCTKNNTTAKMAFSEAEQLAKQTDVCSKVGKFKKHHWCNENSGTWWISLDSKLSNCSPACVIDVVNKTTTVNYMCMGLLPSNKKPKNNQ